MFDVDMFNFDKRWEEAKKKFPDYSKITITEDMINISDTCISMEFFTKEGKWSISKTDNGYFICLTGPMFIKYYNYFDTLKEASNKINACNVSENDDCNFPQKKNKSQGLF